MEVLSKRIQYFDAHLSNITRDAFAALITWEIPKVLGALCQKLDEDQVYISCYKL